MSANQEIWKAGVAGFRERIPKPPPAVSSSSDSSSKLVFRSYETTEDVRDREVRRSWERLRHRTYDESRAPQQLPVPVLGDPTESSRAPGLVDTALVGEAETFEGKITSVDDGQVVVDLVFDGETDWEEYVIPLTRFLSPIAGVAAGARVFGRTDETGTIVEVSTVTAAELGARHQAELRDLYGHLIAEE